MLKFFQRLRKYRLRLNPNKWTFGVWSGKLLGFIASQKGIEVDPDKVKAIPEIPETRTEKAKLKKDQICVWTDDIQMEFESIK